MDDEDVYSILFAFFFSLISIYEFYYFYFVNYICKDLIHYIVIY